MIGTDKQIAWATKIQAEKIALMQDFVARKRALCPTSRIAEYDASADKMWAIINAKTDAVWWIDRRDRTSQDLVVEAYKEANK